MGKKKPGSARGWLTLPIKVYEADEVRAGEIEAKVVVFGRADTVTVSASCFTTGPQLAAHLESLSWSETMRIQAAILECVLNAIERGAADEEGEK